MATSQHFQKSARRRVEELRQLASRTAGVGLEVTLSQRKTVFDAAERLEQIASSLERNADKEPVEPAIALLASNATADEVKTARRRQAIRRGAEVYLPSWSAIAWALPNAFLRTALFSTTRSVQARNEELLSGSDSLLVAGKEIASFANLTLTFSGYELCQFDKRVYAACLDYYRDIPLSPEERGEYVSTSFYEFVKRLGNKYSLKAHRAVRASLLRLSFAQMRLRYKRMNIEVPKLLSVSFEDGDGGGDFKGSDLLMLRVSESIAELFGWGAWTALSKDAAAYDGLTGWLASFYASHSLAQWLPIKDLYRLSGYESHMRNFKSSLTNALEKLKATEVPDCSRISAYHVSKDGSRICVVRAKWAPTKIETPKGEQKPKALNDEEMEAVL
ncbi:plasmid replication initiator TrfA [Paraburkholderia strydomiana]|uniref:hypothetical protein n=1 Tax=Paraburkholderia strydomiana TaxID=1245417 RepID=UPI0038B7BD4F